MITCPQCHKGFITKQENLVDTGSGNFKTTSVRHYEFCSNVMCDWNVIKYERLTDPHFVTKLEKKEIIVGGH